MDRKIGSLCTIQWFMNYVADLVVLRDDWHIVGLSVQWW